MPNSIAAEEKYKKNYSQGKKYHSDKGPFTRSVQAFPL